MHSHCVTRRSAHWARALTSTTPARSKFRDSACRQLPSLKLKKKKKKIKHIFSKRSSTAIMFSALGAYCKLCCLDKSFAQLNKRCAE